MVIVAEPSVQSLSGLTPHYRGRSGERGRGGFRVGATGNTVKIRVKSPYDLFFFLNNNIKMIVCELK